MDIGTRILRKNKNVGLEDLTALSVTITVFWDVTSCSRKKRNRQMKCRKIDENKVRRRKTQEEMKKKHKTEICVTECIAICRQCPGLVAPFWFVSLGRPPENQRMLKIRIINLNFFRVVGNCSVIRRRLQN